MLSCSPQRDRVADIHARISPQTTQHTYMRIRIYVQDPVHHVYLWLHPGTHYLPGALITPPPPPFALARLIHVLLDKSSLKTDIQTDPRVLLADDTHCPRSVINHVNPCSKGRV